MDEIEGRSGPRPRARRIRMPNGSDWPVARLPQWVTCGVCGARTPVPARKGRVPCAHCGALVLTVL